MNKCDTTHNRQQQARHGTQRAAEFVCTLLFLILFFSLLSRLPRQTSQLKYFQRTFLSSLSAFRPGHYGVVRALRYVSPFLSCEVHKLTSKNPQYISDRVLTCSVDSVAQEIYHFTEVK